MASADSLYRTFAGLDLPVTADDVVNNSLAGLDPANTILANLLKAAINAELGDGWAVLSLSSPAVFSSVPVEDVMEMEPTAQLLGQRKHGWPLLFVYRSSEPAAIEEYSIQEDRLSQKWGVDYVLGPLSIGDERKTRGGLIAVAKIIALTLRQGGHPAYLKDSSNNPVNVLGPGYCEFTGIKITEFRLGAARFAEDAPAYHAMSMTLTTDEVSGGVNEAGLPEYLGTSIHAGQGTIDGTIENFIDADSEQPSGHMD